MKKGDPVGTDKSGRLKLSKKETVVSGIELVLGVPETEEGFYFRDFATTGR